MDHDELRVNGWDQALERVNAALGGSSGRWRPSRLILQQYWHFEYQEFHFAQGRLVLRGANTTGKSTVLVSAITLALDGEKRRERMDTFGGQGRGVAYYLVGDADADETSDYYYPERTGYVALEFEKGDLPQYLTIGVGLYTSRTRPDLSVDSWGFVITDGRRVGREMHLYTPQRLPLTARQLADRLGVGGQVFTRAGDYQEEVNRQLFQFRSVDEYRFLLDLLIQIRSPKLNKDLKPSAICQLLSQSLPALPEGIVTRVTRIMDDIDSYLDLLKDLERRLEAVAAIDQAEAAAANQLAQLAAVEYTEALAQAREVLAQHQQARADLARTEAERERLAARLDELSAEGSRLAGRRSVLTQGEAYREIQQIETLRRDVEAARRALVGREESQTASQESLRRVEELLRARQEAWTSLVRRLAGASDQLLAQAEESRWPLATEEAGRQAEAVRALPASVPPEAPPNLQVPAAFLREAAAERRLLLDEVSRRLAQVRERQREHDALAGRAEERQRELEAADTRVRQARADLGDAQAQVRAALESWRDRLQVLAVAGEDWEQVLSGIDAFGPGQRPTWEGLIQPLVASAASQRFQIESRRRQEERALDRLRAELEPLEQELAAWKEGREVAPPQREGQEQARRLLAERGIPAAPLYRVVRFKHSVPEADRPLLEATLEASGLLDALVVSPDLGGLVADHLREAGLGDLWIDPSRDRPVGPTLLDLLEPDPDRSEPLPDETVRAALASIGWRGSLGGGTPIPEVPASEQGGQPPGPESKPGIADHGPGIRDSDSGVRDSDSGVRNSDSGVPSWVAPGAWAHGRLAGTGMVPPESEVAYLGREAREAARQRQIARLTRQVQELGEAIWSQEEVLDQHRKAFQHLETEVAALHELDGRDLLPERALQVEQAEAWLQERRKALNEAEQAVGKALEALQAARAAYQHSLAPVPEARGRDEEGLRALYEATERVLQQFEVFAVLTETLEASVHEWQRLRQEEARSRERLAKDQAAVRDAQERLEEHEGRLNAAEEKLQEMGLSAQELLAELEELENRLKAIDREEAAARTDLGVLTERYRVKTGEVERLQDQRYTALEELERRRFAFRERLAAHPTLTGHLARFDQAGSEPPVPIPAPGHAVGAPEELSAGTGGAGEAPSDPEARATETGPEEVADELLRLRRSTPGRLRESVDRSVREALQELGTVFTSHRPALAEYGPELHEDRVAFRHRGTPVEAYRLRAGLESERDLQRRYLEQKERELYEQVILHEVAGEIRQRIRLAEGWRDEINRLLESQKLSNGEILSIAWLPRSGQTSEALSYRRVIELLLRDADTLTPSELDELIDHFRQRVNGVREGYRKGSLGEGITFAQALHQVLDYRDWFVFSLHSRLPNEPRRHLTDIRFASRSGAEKSLAMFVPLLAALHARYRSAAPDAPRLMGLDEAFAGVDETNVQEMYRFLVSLDFSWVMTSEKLWGQGSAVPACSTYELLRRGTVVTALWFLWDGNRRHQAGVTLPNVASQASAQPVNGAAGSEGSHRAGNGAVGKTAGPGANGAAHPTREGGYDGAVPQ